jgi:hypothetical protein
VPFSLLTMKNLEGLTPKELFNKTHGNLRSDGEKWMRDRATGCMFVANLIAIMAFAATVTVPGGNDQIIGTPIFLKHNWFVAFYVSDSIALLSSSSSIVCFWSIITCGYTDKDFLYSLPRRLAFGLITLLIAMVSIVIASTASCFLVYQRGMILNPIFTIWIISIAISFCLSMHYRLLVDAIRPAALWPRYIFRPHNRRFF